LSTDSRIYHATYTELNSVEIAQLLNQSVDISHIPDSQLPHHQLIQQQIQQQVSQSIDSIQQQNASTMRIQSPLQVRDYNTSNGHFPNLTHVRGPIINTAPTPFQNDHYLKGLF